MENNELVTQIEKMLGKWIKGLKDIENIAAGLEIQTIELENECSSRKSLLQILQKDFNYDRNDLRTFTSIQRDNEAETYIKQLELTLEVVMNKYRKLAQNQIVTSNHELKERFNEKQLESWNNCLASIDQKNSVINFLIKMNEEFLSDGSEVTNALLQENMFLKTENATLRKIIAASEKFGNKENSNNITMIQKDD